jgi:hypothetical protein
MFSGIVKECISVNSDLALRLLSVILCMKGPMHIDTLYSVLITDKGGHP